MNYLLGDLKPLSPMEWLIPKELPKNRLALLYGPSGSGKSFVALDYAMRVSATRNVVYWSPGTQGFMARSLAWFNYHHMADVHIHHFSNFTSLVEDNQRDEFIETVKPMQPELIVLDELEECFTSIDLNETAGVILALATLRIIERDLHCSVLIVSRASPDLKNPRGSSPLLDECATVIFVSSSEDEILVSCRKSTNAEPFPQRRLRLLQMETNYGLSAVLVPSSSISA